jgi:hypothetical protein
LTSFTRRCSPRRRRRRPGPLADDLNPEDVARIPPPLCILKVDEHHPAVPGPLAVESRAFPPRGSWPPLHRAVHQAVDGELRGIFAHTHTVSGGGAEVTSKSRTDLLTTTEMYHLDHACQVITAAFGGRPPYLVGSAGVSNDGGSYRDVDVRLMLSDEDFAATCPTRERWELLCLAIGAYLRGRTGLPVDFQLQRRTEALERFGDKPRNPLGLLAHGGRVFAGGGDATPEWGNT